MLSCATCSYESPDSARFCRRCGAPLLAEDEQMDTTRRMQGRQNPTLVATGSTPLPPSIGDAVAGATLRYQPPLASAQPAYAPPGVISPAVNTAALKPKKRRRILKWAGFLLALVISAGIGAGINEESNSGRVYLSREDQARLEHLRAEDRLKRTMTDSVVELHDRRREELERYAEEIERAKDEAVRAAERGVGGTSGEKPLDLSGYEYTGAAAGQYSRIPGRELLTLRTKDDFETVTAFYQERLGPPLLQRTERNQRQTIFQSAGATPVVVLVREGRDRARQPEIIILRAPFRLPILQPEPEPPKAEDSQSQSPEAKPKTAPPAPPKPR